MTRLQLNHAKLRRLIIEQQTGTLITTNACYRMIGQNTYLYPTAVLLKLVSENLLTRVGRGEYMRT